MNSLDLYEFAVPGISGISGQTPPPDNGEESSSSSTATMETSQPSLNEEMNQVMGQLGRFWGGVRKQSQTAFESARKDLGEVVSQAQKGLEMLGQRPTAPIEPALPEVSDEKAADSKPAPEDTAEAPVPDPTPSSTPVNTRTSSGFFSLLQSSLPPNLTPTALSSTLQRHLPENLQQGLNFENATADFTQLRATLTDNIQRVQQGTTMQQAEKLAEEYMHKGEALFKEASVFLKDAVKVLPPEEADGAGVVWDGTDVWTLPPSIQTNVGRTASRKGKAKESNVLFNAPMAAAKRADILLKKLRNDPDLLRKDPELEEDLAIKEAWESFVKEEVDAHGGIVGEVWTTRVSTALEGHDEDEDAKALTVLRDLLVPTEMTNDAFWTRYFFRVRQIEREEERRKALLDGANQDVDDFTWEDEEELEDEEGGGGGGGDDRVSALQAEEKTPVKASSSSSGFVSVVSREDATPSTPTAPVSVPTASTSQTPVCVSPRESEDSYSVVSSGNVSSTGGKVGEKKAKSEVKSDDDGDESDWE